MIEFIFIAQLIGSIDCSFGGGFEKGLKDFRGGSFGADPDRFCYGEAQTKRSQFLDAYNLGRDNSALFEKVGMNSIPKDETEFKEIVKEARALQIQLKVIEQPPTESPSPSPSQSPTARQE